MHFCRFILILFIIVQNIAGFSQSDPAFFDSIPNRFRLNEFNVHQVVLHHINLHRHQKKLDILKVRAELSSTAIDYSRFLYKNDKASFKKTEKRERVEDYMMKYYGSRKFDYVVVKTRLSKGDYKFTYSEIGQNIVNEITKREKTKNFLENNEHKYIGIGFKSLANNKYIEGIIIFGSYNSINPGLFARDKYKYPSFSLIFANINNNNYHLASYDKRACSKVDKFDFYDELRDNIYVENKRIYLDVHDKKSFRRLFRDAKDGIAVDFVFKDQYPCNQANVINYNLINKGMMFPPAYTRKLLKNSKGKRSKTLKIKIAKEFFIQDIMGSRKVRDPYEINLHIIQDKHVCKIITPEKSKSKIKEQREYLLDTIFENIFNYKNNVPVANNYFFHVPFEKNKHNYNIKDIKPFLKSLNKYKGKISTIRIKAFSSIEGNIDYNIELQLKRAKSISQIIEDNQNSVDTILFETKENWTDFLNDIKNSEFNFLSYQTKDSIRNYVNNNIDNEALENILKKHRYANVHMEVKFDFKDQKEELEFYKDRLKSHINSNEINAAKYYQKLIVKKIINNEYSEKSLSDIKIPIEKKYSTLLMNNFWVEKYLISDEIPGLSIHEILPLYQLDSNNVIIRSNYLLAHVNEINNIENYDENFINHHLDFIARKLDDETLRKIELECELKKIDLLLGELNVNDSEEISDVLNQISLNDKNSTSFAKIFIQRGQHLLAEKILDPYANSNNLDYDFWITYLSIFNPNNNNFNNFKFIKALKTSKQLFPHRFCELITDKFYSIQIFENPEVKKLFCEECNLN